MKGLRLRAVVLAAGFGRRLRPLTENEPKPLLPVAGKSILLRTLEQLVAVGCEAVAVNLHHLGERIEERIGDEVGGVPIRYSPEQPILGTLGALAPLEEFLAPADLVLLVNGDSLMRWPFKSLIKRHLKDHGVRATLLASGFADPTRYGGGMTVDSGRVLALRGSPRAASSANRVVFAGAHVFAPELVAGHDVEPADIVTGLYEPLLETGEAIGALISRRPWYDLGTPRRYLDGVLDWAGALPAGGILPGSRVVGRALGRSWTAAPRPSGAKLRRAVVEDDVAIGEEVRIDCSLLLSGAEVGAGSELKECIVGPGAKLPAEAKVEGRLITPQRAGSTPGKGASIVGGMIYSPIDGSERRDRTAL